jgi:hypothetical protein
LSLAAHSCFSGFSRKPYLGRLIQYNAKAGSNKRVFPFQVQSGICFCYLFVTEDMPFREIRFFNALDRIWLKLSDKAYDLHSISRSQKGGLKNESN